MAADKFQQLQYNAWESNHMTKHAELMEKYDTIKQKESSMNEQKGGKVNKRDLLLTQKQKGTIGKLGDIELTMLDKEEVIESNYHRNILAIEQKKERAIRQAEQDYERAMKYYESEREASLSKCKREFESKKRILQSKGENYEAEKAIVSKTGAEITLEITKYKLLKEIKQSIDTITMSRGSVPNGRFIMPLPVMPELLGEPPATLTLQQPAQPTTTATAEEILALMGEDANTAMMREEARANDRRLRREAEEDEMMRQEKALAYRKQLEREAEERRKQNEESRKQNEESRKQDPTPLTQSPIDEEEEEMTQEEIDAYIAKSKAAAATPRQ